MRGFIARFGPSTEGSVAILSAVLLVVLMGFCGLAVDMASAFYWKAKLRSATDLAVLAAAVDPDNAEAVAIRALEANGFSAADLVSITAGDFAEDPAVSAASRFSAGGSNAAFRVETTHQAPLYFARLFMTGSWSIGAEATAYNNPIAVAGLSSGTLDINQDVLNAYSSMVAGNALNLTDAEVAALKAVRIGVFRLFEQFAVEAGSPGASIETINASNLNLASIAYAAFQALSNQIASPTADQLIALNALQRIALEQTGSSAEPISDIIQLNAHIKRRAADLVSEETDALGVPAFSLLTSYLHTAGSDSLISMPSGMGIPGLVKIDVIISRTAAGSGEVTGLMVGPVGTASETAAARLRLTFLSVLPSISLVGVGTIDPSISVLVDITPATATISDISCGYDVSDSITASITGQTGALHLSIGEVSDANLLDFTTSLVPLPATLIDLAGLMTVTSAGSASVLASSPIEMVFDATDMASGTVKRINSTQTLSDGLADAEADISTLITTTPILQAIVNPTVSPFINSTLIALFNTLDKTLTGVIAGLGLDAAYIDLTATSARCGVPVLVN